jgi:predicted phosphohydrolase
MTLKRKIYLFISLMALFFLSIWIKSRWKVWFGNSPEPAYVISAEPQRVLLTFGDHGELSRYVSWMGDTVVDTQAQLLVCDTTSADTLRVPAIGEVFRSRAGIGAYYRAELTELLPRHTYRYAVESQGQRTEWYQFTTQAPEDSAFTFLFLGDVQDTIGGIANQLIRRALADHPETEFVVFGGDLTERPMDKYWAETFASMDSICTAMPVLMILGNHEYLKYLVRKCERRNSLVFPYFLKGMEEREDDNHLFALRYHNTDFYLLDTNREWPFLRQQRSWLKEKLRQSTAQHKVVVGHHPIYSVKRKNNNILVRWTFSDLLEENKVDLVMQGHEHAYARCTSSEQPMEEEICQNPPLYTVSHCSPKNYRIRPTERFSAIHSGSRYYQLITVKRDTLWMQGFDAVTGEKIDNVVIPHQ